MKIFIIAGEASGDLLGAGLMRALKKRVPDAVFYGVGGARMAEAGLVSLFPMEKLSVMGLSEVLPRLRDLLRRIRRTAEEIAHVNPDAVVTIDSPDFCFRVIKKYKAAHGKAPCIHYVAPSVWAWRPGRAKKVAKFLDHLLALLPFEPPYFERYGLATTFVGHPIVERGGRRGDAARFRQKFAIEGDLLCLLPGSRMGEISRLLESFYAAARLIVAQRPGLKLVIPTLPHLRPHLEAFFRDKEIKPLFVEGEEDKFDAFAASNAALAASGTVSLELALTGTPHVISYRLNAVTAFLAKRLIKTPYVNLVNILLGRAAVPELLQEQCTPENMAREILRLLDDPAAREAQKYAFQASLSLLGMGNAETPSEKAARAVLSVVTRA